MFEQNRFSKPYLWLINFIGLIVPRRLRADWRQEWEAELRHREAMLADGISSIGKGNFIYCDAAWERSGMRCGFNRTGGRMK